MSEITMSDVKIVKAADIADVHVNVPLSNMTVAYMQDAKDYICDKVFPTIPVPQISGTYFTFPKNTFLKNRAGKWTPGAQMKQTVIDVEHTGTYSCQFRAVEYMMPWHIKAAADSQLNLDYAAMSHVTQQLLLNREQEWAADFFANSKWTKEYTGNTDFNYWDNPTTSNPIQDIAEARDYLFSQTAKMPNTLVLPYKVYTALRIHPLIKEMFKFYQFPDAREAALARIFDVDNVLIGKALQMSSNDGATDAITDVFSTHAWLGYVPSAPGIMAPASGYQFGYTGMTAGFQIAVERIPDQRDKVDYIQAIQCYDQKLIGADLGAFFVNAITP